jgi:hypothetical protein
MPHPMEVELEKVLSHLSRMRVKRCVFKGREIEVWEMSPFWAAIEGALRQVPSAPIRNANSRPSVGWEPLEE